MGGGFSSTKAKEARARRAAEKLAQSKTWVFTDFIDHQDPAEIDNTIDAIKHVEDDDLSDDEEVENVLAEAKKVLALVVTKQLTHAILDRHPEELKTVLSQATSGYVPPLKDNTLIPEAKIVLAQELKKRLKKSIRTRRQDKLHKAIADAKQTRYFRGSLKTKAYKSLMQKLSIAETVLEEEIQKELNDEVERLADPILQFVDMDPLISAVSKKRVRLLNPDFIHFLKKNGQTLPPRQLIPERAFVNVDKMSPEDLDKLKIVSVSFNRESPNHTRHPDPDGYHLSMLSALLKKFCTGHYSSGFEEGKDAPDHVIKRLEKSKKGKRKYVDKPAHIVSTRGKYFDRKQGLLLKEQLWDRGFCFGAGGGQIVGIFIDWCCLYQDYPMGSRTVQETRAFKLGLDHIESWYASRHTTVWMLNYPYEPPNELVVTLLRGRNLMIKDKFWFSKGGSSDPLARISVDCVDGFQDGKKRGERKSLTKKKTLEPEWNQTFVYPNVRGPDNHHLDIIIEDEDWLSGNDFMGMARICLTDIEDKRLTTKWLPLADKYPPTRNSQGTPNVKGLKNFSPDFSIARGEIEVQLEWRFNPNLETMETRRRRLAMSKGTMWLSVISANGIIAADKNGFSDPYATSELVFLDNGENISRTKKHSTKTIKKTLSPEWNAKEIQWQGITLGNAAVCIKIYDADMVTSELLGTVTIPVCQFDEIELEEPFDKSVIELKTFAIETSEKMKQLATGEIIVKGWFGVTERIKFPVVDNLSSKPEVKDSALQVEMDPAMTVRAQLLFDEACSRYWMIDKRVRHGDASWNTPSSETKLEIAEIMKILGEAADLGHKEAQVELEGRSQTREGRERQEETTIEKINTLDFVMIGAKDLLAADKGGTSDPFALVEIVDTRTGKSVKPRRFEKTRTIKKTLSPKWNERITWSDVIGDPSFLALNVKVYDADLVSKELLGEVSIPVSDWPEGFEFEDKSLDLSMKGKTKGTVYVSLRREEEKEVELSWWEEENRKEAEAKAAEEEAEEWWKEPDYYELSELSLNEGAWTTFERIVALIMTKKGDLLDITADNRQRLLATEPGRVDERDYMQFCLDTIDQREENLFVDPADFEALIHDKRCGVSSIESIFKPIGKDGSHKSDLVWLCERYKRTFETLFIQIKHMNLAGVGLRDEGARRLMQIGMANCRHLVDLNVSMNEIAIPVEEWAQFAKRLNLRKITLSANREEGSLHENLLGTYKHGADVGRRVLRGDIGSFAIASHLRYIDLGVTKVHGSIKPIGEHLHHLTHLDLNRSKVEGEVDSLASLVHLRYLDLFRCFKIGGKVGELRHLTHLKYLNLQATDVEGNIEPLMALREMIFLNLWSCNKLTGDRDRLREKMSRLRRDPFASDDRLMNHGRPEDPHEQLYLDELGNLTADLIDGDEEDSDNEEETYSTLQQGHM